MTSLDRSFKHCTAVAKVVGDSQFSYCPGNKKLTSIQKKKAGWHRDLDDSQCTVYGSLSRYNDPSCTVGIPRIPTCTSTKAQYEKSLGVKRRQPKNAFFVANNEFYFDLSEFVAGKEASLNPKQSQPACL